MSKKLLSALLAALVTPAFATGGFIPANDRTDVAYDDQRNVVYISSGSDVLSFDLETGQFLQPMTMAFTLGGMDISPDGQTLAVAIRNGPLDGLSRMFLIGLDAPGFEEPTVPMASYEGGLFTVTYGADGKVYSTSTFNGSGWVPMRRYDPQSQSWDELASVRQNTMLTPSGDASTIAFAESNISDGRWGIYDIPTGTLVRRQGYTDGTSWFNFEIAVDSMGAQVTIPTYGGAMVYDENYLNTAVLGTYAGPQPIGGVYHPVDRIAYFPFAETSEVRVYDMNTFSQIDAIEMGSVFQHTGNHAFDSGRTKISRDGSLLLVTVDGGVRWEQLYEPLDAYDIYIPAVGGVPTPATLGATIGNGGTINFRIVDAPAHGTAIIDGNQVTYQADAAYDGYDTFTYEASYGRATRMASATVYVSPANRAPVAVDDSAKTRKWAVLVPVLNNDSDPDGDALQIVSVSAPTSGSVRVIGSQIEFTPPKRWSGNSQFDYTISDGHGHLATATVTVTK